MASYMVGLDFFPNLIQERHKVTYSHTFIPSQRQVMGEQWQKLSSDRVAKKTKRRDKTDKRRKNKTFCDINLLKGLITVGEGSI